MRVPIENGLGLFNQVLDFIKLPALPDRVFIYLNSIFPVVRYSSSEKTWYI